VSEHTHIFLNHFPELTNFTQRNIPTANLYAQRINALTPIDKACREAKETKCNIVGIKYLYEFVLAHHAPIALTRDSVSTLVALRAPYACAVDALSDCLLVTSATGFELTRVAYDAPNARALIEEALRRYGKGTGKLAPQSGDERL
jgi:hypothetical protein